MSELTFKLVKPPFRLSDKESAELKTCLATLMGEQGDIFYKLVAATGELSNFEFNNISIYCLNTGKDSLSKHFGLIKYYHNRHLIKLNKRKNY